MPAKTLKKEQSAPPPAYHDGDQERIPLNSYTEVQIQYQIDPLEIQVPVSSQCVEHKLCRKCRALSKTKFVRARLRDQLVDEPEELQYHDNISALWNAVAQHCHLCSLIWQKLIDDGSYRTGKIPGVDEKLTLQLHPATELNHQDTLEIICDAIPTAGEQKRQLALVTVSRISSPLQRMSLPSLSSHGVMMRHWIRLCRETHPKCQQDRTPFRPTRLLDVSQSGVVYLRMTGEPELGPKSFKRTLTQFSDRDTRNVEYCALSHCWGGAKDILTLTTGTARELELGVTIESLPKTFREAVGVARDLGLRYIWIDSLCITQDSAQDWLKESKRMVDVYSNAICTLAASGSINSHGGLFHARNPLTYLNCQIGQSSFFSSSSVRTFVSAKNAPSISEERNSTSFGKRAWTIQEQLLSTRLIYFGKRGIFWRCDTCVLDENDPTGRGIQRFQGASSDFLTAPDSMEWADRTTLDTVLSVPPPYPTDRGFDERFHTPWNNLVREYFRRSLTLPQDRPMALAGIAAKIQLATLRRYRAGLWEDSIYYDLMWWVKSPSLGKKQLGPGQYAPSWSWASAEGEELSSLSQSWAFVQHWGFEVYMPTQEQEISTHPESQGVKEGLEVHGVIRGLPSECIMPNPDPSSPDPYILTVTVAEEKLGVIYPDTQSMDRDDLVLLLCFQDKMEHVTPMRYSEYIICGLVLKPVDGNEGTNNYYRVGAFKFSSDSKISSAMEWFARYPAQRITMF